MQWTVSGETFGTSPVKQGQTVESVLHLRAKKDSQLFVTGREIGYAPETTYSAVERAWTTVLEDQMATVHCTTLVVQRTIPFIET